MRGRFDFELVSVSQWFNGITPVRKTGDMRFKSQLTHKFSSQYLSTKVKPVAMIIVHIFNESYPIC